MNAKYYRHLRESRTDWKVEKEKKMQVGDIKEFYGTNISEVVMGFYFMI